MTAKVKTRRERCMFACEGEKKKSKMHAEFFVREGRHP